MEMFTRVLVFIYKFLLSAGLLVAVVVGVLEIVERIGKFTIFGYHLWVDRRARREDGKIIEHMKSGTKRNGLYDVEEIASALKRPAREVLESLERLQDENRVRRLEVNEVDGGIWGLHQFERQKAKSKTT